MKTRHTFTATLLVALLAIAGVTAAIAADPAEPPPPRIAFLANGRVPADALAAGPIAGQLGAPVYTTEQHALPDSTADALAAYNPELVIVMGGSVAISDAVVAAVSSATGLPVVDPSPPPATGVVRAAGADRFVTATIVADLLGAYDPAYLGVDLQAIDADMLDGMDSSAFLGATDKAVDSDTLDGQDSTAFVQGAVLSAVVDGTSLARGAGAVSVTALGPSDVAVEFDRDVSACAWVASIGEPHVSNPDAGATLGTALRSGNPNAIYVQTYDNTGADSHEPFHLMVYC